MMKRTVLFSLLLLCSLLSGCVSSGPQTVVIAPTARVMPDYEEMEIYQQLHGAVTEDSSLEEIINAFSEMCKIPVATSTEMFLYEVYSYEFEAEAFLNCHIVRQVDDPGTDEFIQLHLDIIYRLEEDIAGFEETTWFEEDPEGFVQHIRSGSIYQTLLGKPIHERYVSIDSTW